MNHDELAFVAEMSSANQAIAVYIGRVLDIDAGRTEYGSALPAVEQLLAARLFAVAHALRANAIGRVDTDDGSARARAHVDEVACTGVVPPFRFDF